MTIRATLSMLAAAAWIGLSLPGGASAAEEVRVYVTNSTENSVWVIDASSLAVVAKIPLPQSGSPAQVVLSPDGSQAYVLNAEAGIIVIDTGSNRVVRAATYDWAQLARAIAVSADGSRLFVTTAGAVVSVDARTLAEIGRNTDLPEGYGVTAAPSTDTVYVSRTFPASFTALDSENLDSLGQTELPPFFAPQQAHFDTQGANLYVACGAGTAIVDASTLLVVGTLPFAAADAIPSPDGRTLFVARNDLQITAVNVTSGQGTVVVVGDHNARGVGAVQLALTPDGGRLFVNDVAGDELRIIDTATLAVSELAVGTSPTSVAVGAVDVGTESDGCQTGRGAHSSTWLLLPALAAALLARRARGNLSH